MRSAPRITPFQISSCSILEAAYLPSSPSASWSCSKSSPSLSSGTFASCLVSCLGKASPRSCSLATVCVSLATSSGPPPPRPYMSRAVITLVRSPSPASVGAAVLGDSPPLASLARLISTELTAGAELSSSFAVECFSATRAIAVSKSTALSYIVSSTFSCRSSRLTFNSVAVVYSFAPMSATPSSRWASLFFAAFSACSSSQCICKSSATDTLPIFSRSSRSRSSWLSLASGVCVPPSVPCLAMAIKFNV